MNKQLSHAQNSLDLCRVIDTNKIMECPFTIALLTLKVEIKKKKKHKNIAFIEMLKYDDTFQKSN
jgi:hypothetical protein